MTTLAAVLPDLAERSTVLLVLAELGFTHVELANVSDATEIYFFARQAELDRIGPKIANRAISHALPHRKTYIGVKPRDVPATPLDIGNGASPSR